jgi:hypothetical protein
MGARKFPDTSAEIARIQQGRAPPVFPEPLSGGTRVTGLWHNVAFDSYVPGLKEHVIVGHFTGVCDQWTKTDGRVLTARAGPGHIDVIPAGHDGWRRASGNIEVSNHRQPAAARRPHQSRARRPSRAPSFRSEPASPHLRSIEDEVTLAGTRLACCSGFGVTVAILRGSRRAGPRPHSGI